MFSFDDPIIVKYQRHGQKKQTLTATCLPDTDQKAIKAVDRYERLQVVLATPNPTKEQKRAAHKKLMRARATLFDVICTDLDGPGARDEGGKLVPISSVDGWHKLVPDREKDQIAAIYLSRTVVDEGEAGN